MTPTRASAPAKAREAAPPGVSGRNREFLPAAIEILETPAPPLPVAMMLTICAFFALAIAWSFIGRLDVNAVAPGKLEATGRVKVIQSLDPGKVAAIHAENGARVKAGDLLLELDPAEAAADEREAREALQAGLSEVARRRRAIVAARAAQRLAAENGAPLPALEALAANPQGKIDWGEPPPDGVQAREEAAPSAGLSQLADTLRGKIDWDEPAPDSVRTREEAVLSADLSQLADTLRALDKQVAEKQATLQRLRMSIAYQTALINTLTERVDTRQQAIDLRVGTKINLYDAKEELQRSQSSLASDQGQLIETDAAIGELQSEKTKALSQFIAENENKAEEASRKADEARQAFAKATSRLASTKLYAPIDGVVQQLSVTTFGQVVGAGQQLATVTPTDGALRVEALVANMDIGFVRIGQEVAVKLDAFPFTRFGALHGKVVAIAAAAVDEQQAKRSLANATTPGNAAPDSVAPGQAPSFVFPVTVAIDETAMHVDGATIPLASGMTATVDIKTESRRVIDYLLSPLAKTMSEAMTER
jgi:hemolysin D